jgi:hypothetical protein
MYVLLERSNAWAYDVPALLLTIDISVPESPVIEDAFQLVGISPNVMKKHSNNLYIACWGITGWSKGGHTPVGGIEKVSLAGGPGSYTSAIFVDDDDGSDTYGNSYTYDGFTADVEIVDATLGFIYIAEWNAPEVYKVYPFDPSTGTVDTGNVILNNINLSKIGMGPDGLLYCSASAWYGLGTDAGIYTVDPGMYTVTGPKSTGLEPVDFAFNQ